MTLVENEPGAELVDWADRAVSSGKGDYAPGALLSQVLSKAGMAHALSPLGQGSRSFTSPAVIFDVLAYGSAPVLRRHFEQFFEVVAYPGERLRDTFEPGDLLVERALGEGTLASVSLLVSGQPILRGDLGVAGLQPLSDCDGYFVHVVEGGAFPKPVGHRQARQLADTSGHLGLHQMVVRLRDDAIAPAYISGHADEEGTSLTETHGLAETANADPTHWFLTEEEIRAARGGEGEAPDRSLSVFTSRNVVQPLVDGAAMMQALRDDLVATRGPASPPRGPTRLRGPTSTPGDFIHFTAWRMDWDQNLVPSQRGNTVGDLWRSAIRDRGVASRTLLYGAQWPLSVGGVQISVGSGMGRTGRENRKTRRRLIRAGAEAAYDDRFPFAGSHHQKTAVVLRNGQAVATCGGIDLAGDRWDTPQHNNDPRRRREFWPGWHDVHTRLRGPAVHDIELNFRDRWNDPTSRGLGATPIRDPLPPVAPAPGTHYVQVLRTYACHRYPFASLGEFTYLAGYRKAIRRAQTYIYIEDQYLVFDELAHELVRALDRIQKLIIVVPKETDAFPASAFNWHQNHFIQILRAADPNRDKVYVYHLVQPTTGRPIYVHAKLMIVDDIYAVIGSANINRRSMTHDTEIGVAVVDADVVGGACRFARDLRLRLWAEHLHLDPGDPSIVDPVRGAAVWERQATQCQMRQRRPTMQLRRCPYRVRHHVTPTPQTEHPFIWQGGSDPDGRCAQRPVTPPTPTMRPPSRPPAPPSRPPPGTSPRPPGGGTMRPPRRSRTRAPRNL